MNKEYEHYIFLKKYGFKKTKNSGAIKHNADFELSYKSKYIIVDSKYRNTCLLYTSPSPRDLSTSRMPSSA